MKGAGHDSDAINGTAFPAGVVDNWDINGSVAELQIDHGPFDTGPGGEPDPVVGSQFALSNSGGNGAHVVIMDLTNSASLSLNSFYYANRGNFPPKLTVEYFDLNEQSLGTDEYTAGVDGGPGVGLATDYNPKFQLIEPSASFLYVALSKLVITSEHDDAANLGGAFMMDEMLLRAVTNLLGDMDGDGSLTLANVPLFVEALANRDAYDAEGYFVNAHYIGDIDGSGTFDFGDLSAFNGLTFSASSASAVPEPSSVMLLGIALGVVMLRRRRLSP